MLEDLAMQYYAEDELSDDLQTQIEQCRQRSERIVSAEVKQIIHASHSFHDWYMTECAVYCESETKFCKIALFKGNAKCRVLFSGVSFLSISGELISHTANYPGAWENASIAQVLAIWLDYQKRLECCWLLDNERFMLLKAEDISIHMQ